MSSFLSIPAEEMANVPEPEVLRVDEEVKLQVTDVDHKVNRNDEPYILVRFSVVEYENIKTFTRYFGLPFEGQEADKRNNCMRSLKYFFEAFDIDYSTGELDLEQFVGAQGWAMLKVNENEGSEYGPQNEIKRFVIPG